MPEQRFNCPKAKWKSFDIKMFKIKTKNCILYLESINHFDKVMEFRRVNVVLTVFQYVTPFKNTITKK